MNLLQIILHVVNCGLSMVPVLCHKVKIPKVLDAQQGVCERNHLARQRIWKSHPDNWNNHMPDCFYLLTTPLGHLSMWLVESSEARIWRHHDQEQIQFVDPGILFEGWRYPAHQMLQHSEIDGMKNIRYDIRRRRNAFHIPEGAFWGSNCSIVQILSCFPSLRLFSLSREYYLLEVQPIVSQLTGWLIPLSKRRLWCFAHRAMGLLDWVQMNVFEVVSHPCTDDRITLPHPTNHTKHKLSSVE